MDERPTERGAATVSWERLPPASVERPIVRRLPHVELKLEHPDLDATGHSERFFPNTVPYAYDGVERVFYWRPSLASPVGQPGDWAISCATTDGLCGYEALPASAPSLVARTEAATVVVVDGTIGGETTTARVREYATPAVQFERATVEALWLTVDGTEHVVEAGDRRRLSLSERRLEPLEGEPSTTQPELVVRYPGTRELHHPGIGSTDLLFPSFGLDLETVPNPLSLPTVGGELDEETLAEHVGVDLSARPFPERTLWQAFAYTTFDPHRTATPQLTQLESGHLVVDRESVESTD